ncbi:hypothetical protein CYMTET_44990 [Cymbomonas tetramitiformis]|uniref:Uncharacterized protein n=1 Tax=Cymbomonas tetramitiformis TaxID=36881 RepID=A0AAE0EZ13_9CHLO|nr:hypothetical protein CYMTET_44990 [Cymbomonas tetramitiformis]
MTSLVVPLCVFQVRRANTEAGTRTTLQLPASMLVEGSAHAQANAILPQAPRRRAAEDVDERRAIRVKRTKSGDQGGAGVPKTCRPCFEKTGKTVPMNHAFCPFKGGSGSGGSQSITSFMPMQTPATAPVCVPTAQVAPVVHLVDLVQSPPAAPVHMSFAAPTLAPAPLLQPTSNGAAFGVTPRN